MREITLTNSNKVVLVDDEDFERLNQYNWRICLPSLNIAREGSHLYMSRVIMKCPAHLEVDHKNYDRLNFCRSNLRICTHTQNGMNQRARLGSSSKYKGVTFYNKNKTWQARLMLLNSLGQRICKYLGRFVSEEEAARAYDEAAREHHKEFASLNFPKKGEQSCLRTTAERDKYSQKSAKILKAFEELVKDLKEAKNNVL